MEEKVLKIVDRYKNRESKILPILHGIQDEFGYIPKRAMEIVAKALGRKVGEIYDSASFYSFFRFEKPGRHIVLVCDCIVCSMKGSGEIIDGITKEYGIKNGETTEDGKFTLQIVDGLGHCEKSPVMMIDERVYGNMTGEKALKILRGYE